MSWSIHSDRDLLSILAVFLSPLLIQSLIYSLMNFSVSQNSSLLEGLFLTDVIHSYKNLILIGQYGNIRIWKPVVPDFLGIVI